MVIGTFGRTCTVSCLIRAGKKARISKEINEMDIKNHEYHRGVVYRNDILEKTTIALECFFFPQS